MDASKFAQSKEVSVTSFDEAIAEAEHQFTYNSRQAQLSNIFLGDEGFIRIGDQTLHSTVEGLGGLCRQLRIPDPFANRIPYDLLQTNVERLTRESPAKPVNVHTRIDDTLINISKAGFVQVDHKFFLGETRKIFPSPEQLNINIGDQGLDIDILRFANRLEAVVGDPVRVGLRLSSSPTGLWHNRALLMLWVLRCTNGAVMPRSWGGVSFTLRPDKSNEVITKRFFKNVQELAPNFELLSTLVSKSGSSFLSEKNISTHWRRLRKVGLDQNTADRLLLLTEEERKDIIASYRESRRKVTRGRAETIEETPTKVKAYGAFDSISTYAKDCDQSTREALQEVCGDIINDLKVSLN